MADEHADDAPDDPKAARKQIEILQQTLTIRNNRIHELEQAVQARDGQTQEAEHDDRQLLLPTQYTDNTVKWLLDFAMQLSGVDLLEALSHPEVPLPSTSATLGGASTTILSPVDAAALSAEVIKRCCFRFLDLPAELRNRVYDLSAKAAFSVPCMVACREYGPDVPYNYDDDIRRKWKDHIQKLMHTEASQYRLGMLRVSRQVHDEARQVYYANMSLDFRCIYMAQALPTTLELIASPFRTKLQFVRHIEVEIDVAHCLLFGAWGVKPDKVVSCFWQRICSSGILPIRSIERVGIWLFNLESMTITVGDCHLYAGHRRGIGLEVVASLIGRDDRARGYLERKYPRLSDIVTVNDSGSERLRKTAPKQWEIWYSRERLPDRLRDDFTSVPGGHSTMDKAADTETGLMNARSLSILAPPE